MPNFQIKDKIGRFTPKTGRKKTKLKNLDPLSVDTSQYRISSLDHQDSTENSGNQNTEDEEEEDLIDFSDPIPSTNDFDSIFLTKDVKNLNNSNGTKDSGLSLSDNDKYTSLYPVLDGLSPSTSSSNQSSNRQSNGSYGLELSKWSESPNFRLNEQPKKHTSDFSNWEKFE